MVMLANKGLLLAKINTSGTYGGDAVPVAALNSLLISDLTPAGDLPPLERSFLRASLARLPHVVGRKLQRLDFTAEIKGSPALGMRPEWSPLARCSGFQETVTATITSIRTAALKWTQIGSTSKYYVDLLAGGDPSLANPSTVYENGQDMTRGSSLADMRAGQFWYGDPASLGFNTVVVWLTDGTDPDSKDLDYVKHVAGTKVEYAPRSTGFEDATLHGYMDGVLHKLTGAFGRWTQEYRGGDYGRWNAQTTGLWNDVTDVAIPTGSNFHAHVPPIGENMAITLDAWSAGKIRSLTINGAVEFTERLDLNAPEGFGGLHINARPVGGTMVLEAVTEAVYAFWSKAKAGTSFTFSATLGTSPNSIIHTAPKVQIGAPRWSVENGLRIYTVELFFNQNVADADDDFKMTLQ